MQICWFWNVYDRCDSLHPHSILMFFTFHLYKVEYFTTFWRLLLSAVNPTVSFMSLPLISHREWIENSHSALLAPHKWTCTACVIFCSSDRRMCADFTLSSSVMFKPNNFLSLQVHNMKACGFTASPTWSLIVPKSPHSNILNIRYVHFHCDIITLRSILLSVRSA